MSESLPKRTSATSSPYVEARTCLSRGLGRIVFAISAAGGLFRPTVSPSPRTLWHSGQEQPLPEPLDIKRLA